MRIVKLSELSDEERKKYEEQRQQREQNITIEREAEQARVHKLLNNEQNNNTQRVNRKLDNSIRTTPLPSARKRFQEDNADKLKTAKEVSKEEYEVNSFNKFKNDIINNPNKATSILTDVASKIQAGRINSGMASDKEKRAFETLNLYQGIADNAVGTVGLIANLDAEKRKIMGKMFNNNDLYEQGNRIQNTMKAISDINNYSNKVTSNLDNGAYKTTTQVMKTIANMAPSMALSAVTGGATTAGKAATFLAKNSGALLQATGVAGNETTSTLNEENSNFGKAFATGVLKGGVEYGTEKLFGGNILAKGTSIDNLVSKGISNRVKGKVGQFLASKGYEFAGEQIEELISDNAGYVIDKLINNKDMPGFNEWLQNTGETAKTTFLTSLVLQSLGLGGGTYNEVKQLNLNKQQEQEMNKWISEAQSIIKSTTEQQNTQGQQITQPQNKMSLNQTSEQMDGMLNNGKLPQQGYQYKMSSNTKINNLRQDANKYFNNSDKTKNYINMLEKIINDKDIEIRFDSNLKTAEGKIANGSYSNGVITINPNSTRAGEFIAIHELTHAIGTKDMLNMVENYRKSNIEFDNAVKGLLKNYKSTEITEEALADISGQLFGNQEFINNVANNNPSMFRKIYNEIKYLWHQFRGYKNQDQFVEDLYYKWTQAYNSNNKLNETSNYLKRITNSGIKYTELDGKLFKNADGTLKTPREAYNSIIGQTLQLEDGSNVKLVKKLPGNKDIYNELIKRQPRSKNINDIKNINNKINGNIDEILEQSDFINNKIDVNNRHKDNDIISFDTREAKIYDGNQAYNLTLSIAELSNGEKVGYAKKFLRPDNQLTQEIKKEVSTSSTSKNGRSSRMTTSNNSIPSSNEDVNTTKYSIQESENNSDSFNLKEKQLDIVIKNNPMLDNYHTGIRSIDDIKTYNEAFQEELDGEIQDLTPDFKSTDLEKALKTGKMTVYSSYPIKQGVFVTPSKMEAQSYAGNKNVYSKEVNIEDVAWIDTLQGQYAKVDDTKIRKKSVKESKKDAQDNLGRKLSKEQQEYFKDSKIRDENGKLLIMYHGTPNGEFSIFKGGSYFTSNKEYAEGYQNTWASSISTGKEAKNPKTYEVYLNITNPFTLSNKKAKDIYINEYIKGGNSAYYDPYTDYTNDINNLDEIDWVEGEDLKEWLQENHPEFDGLILDEGGDGGYGEAEYRWRGKSIIPFNSNQIKNVNNTNPTSNPDIRYSQNNKTWQQYLDENYKSTGTRTNMQDLKLPMQEVKQAPYTEEVVQRKRTLNPTEISNLKQEDASTTPQLKEKNYTKGNKQSSFYSNIVNDSKFLNEDLRQEMSKEENIKYYKGITNAETLEKAYNKLKKDGQSETVKWHSKDSKNANAEDVVEGWILLKQYQDAGDYKSAVEVAKKMRDIGTTAGQTVQAYNILSRLTPEGMFYYAQSELDEAYNKMVQGKSKEWIEKNQSNFDLTPEETQNILDIMQDVSKMEDGYDKKVKLAEVQKIITDKIPATKSQSLKAWMRISMLFNPKTQVRNVAGNAIVLPVNMFSDSVSAGIDRIIAKKTGVRTTGNTNLKNYAKGFGKGVFESYNDFRKGINTRNIEGNRFEVTEGRSFNNKGIGKALNRVDNILSFMLDAGDRGFYEATFTNSINNQLILNKTTEVTQDMIDIATNEALQRTWQDNNAYTEAVLKIRKILNFGQGYGLGDVLIPFAKTPANLTKAIVDYSPVGLAKTLATDVRKLNNSLENGQYTPQLQHKVVQNIGKGMAGSFLYILGYALASAGIASGEADDDKDVKNFMKNSLGINSYSIKIGDKSFSYDWAQPIATPIAIMSNYVKYSKDNPDANALEKFWKSMNIGTEQLLEQSFMQSLNTVLNGSGSTLENLSQAVLELPARAIPTLSKQIADMIDGTQRTSFEYGKPFESAANSVIAKLPVASKILPVSRDTLGNEIQKYGGENNIFNVMFNPANTNKGQLSKAGKEIYDVYMETGDTTIFPRTAPYYINSKGEKVTMTSEQRSEFQKITGDYVENTLNSLLNNKNYKKLSDEQKANLINEIVSDSYSKAKYDVLKIDSKEYEKLRKTLETVKPNSYYDYKFKTEDMKKDSEKTEVILNANYTDKEKRTLYENYIVGEGNETYEILKKSGLNINSYMAYKLAESNGEFASDKKEDGTVDGKSVSGSAKKKTYEYVNKMNATYEQKLLLLGMKYSLTSNEKTKLANYVNGMKITKKEKLEIYDKLSGFTVYKDGRVTWK